MNAVAQDALQLADGHEFASIEAERLNRALGASRAGERRDRLVRMIYAGVVAGAINDHDATALQATVDGLQAAARKARAHGPRELKFAPRRRPRSPDRQSSLDRRRMLAGAAAMPPNMRCVYTQGESAAIAVILGEIKRQGVCDLPIDAIAALAGCSRSTTQNALRVARRLAHLRVTERPQRGAKSLTNIVEIVSPELRAWVARGPLAHRATGLKTSTAIKKLSSTKSKYKKILSESSDRRGFTGSSASPGRFAPSQRRSSTGRVGHTNEEFAT